MSSALPLFPQSASTVAQDVDNLFFFILAVSVFFAVLVSVLILFFTFKYRGKKPGDAGADIHGSLTLELLWTGIPFLIAMAIFVWGAQLFFLLEDLLLGDLAEVRDGNLFAIDPRGESRRAGEGVRIDQGDRQGDAFNNVLGSQAHHPIRLECCVIGNGCHGVRRYVNPAQ